MSALSARDAASIYGACDAGSIQRARGDLPGRARRSAAGAADAAPPAAPSCAAPADAGRRRSRCARSPRADRRGRATSRASMTRAARGSSAASAAAAVARRPSGRVRLARCAATTLRDRLGVGGRARARCSRRAWPGSPARRGRVCASGRACGSTRAALAADGAAASRPSPPGRRTSCAGRLAQSGARDPPGAGARRRSGGRRTRSRRWRHAWRAAGGGVVELLGPAEAGDAARAMTRPPRATGRLPDVAALLAHVDAYVGNDSGVSHLAGAVGARGVVVFTATDPRDAGDPSGHVCIALRRAGERRPRSRPSVPSACWRALGGRGESLTSSDPGLASAHNEGQPGCGEPVSSSSRPASRAARSVLVSEPAAADERSRRCPGAAARRRALTPQAVHRVDADRGADHETKRRTRREASASPTGVASPTRARRRRGRGDDRRAGAGVARRASCGSAASRPGEPFGGRGEEPRGASRAPEEPVNFSTFVLGLSTQALLHLGEIEDPVTGRVERGSRRRQARHRHPRHPAGQDPEQPRAGRGAPARRRPLRPSDEVRGARARASKEGA